MRPQADFACLSKHCTDEGGAVVYELPVDATHCPRGHKRLRRLYNKIAVIGTIARAPEIDWRATSSSALDRSKALLGPSFEQYESTRPSRSSMTVTPGSSEQEINMPGGKTFRVPSRQQIAAMSGARGERGHAMTPSEIAQAAKREPWSPAAITSRLDHKRSLDVATHFVNKGG